MNDDSLKEQAYAGAVDTWTDMIEHYANGTLPPFESHLDSVSGMDGIDEMTEVLMITCPPPPKRRPTYLEMYDQDQEGA